MRGVLYSAAVSLAATGLWQPVFAQGLELTGALSQSFILDHNEDFMESGDEVIALTTLGFGLSSETRTQRLSAETSIGLEYDSETEDFTLSRPFLMIDYDQDLKRSTYGFGLFYEDVPTEFDATLPDLSTVGRDTDRQRITGDLSASFSLTERTTFGVAFAATDISYDDDDPDLVPTRNYELDFSLSRELTERTTGTIDLGFDLLKADNATMTETRTHSLNGRLSYEATPRLTLAANAGTSVSEVEETTAGVVTTEDNTSVLYGASLTYALARGEARLSLDQSLVPSSDGELSRTTILAGNLDTELSDISTLGLEASLSYSEDLDGGEEEEFLSVGATYSRDLTENLSGLIGARVERNDDGEYAQELRLEISRSFQVRP